jgi:hypothetical protein
VLTSRRRFRVQVRLRDILALVVGYAMAALLFRAFWPSTIPAILLGLPIVALYVWLGLAMSGPIILLRDGPRTGQSAYSQPHNRPIASRTWAESAWILIGIYWIVLGLFVIPARLHAFQSMDAVWYGVVPVVVAAGFRCLGPSPSPTETGRTPWTHFVAVGLLATWPVAWVCLLVLGKSLR